MKNIQQLKTSNAELSSKKVHHVKRPKVCYFVQTYLLSNASWCVNKEMSLTLHVLLFPG